MMRHGTGDQRISNLMAAGQSLQVGMQKEPTIVFDVKTIMSARLPDVCRTPRRRLGEAKCLQLAAGVLNGLAHRSILDIRKDHTFGWHQRGKRLERLNDRIQTRAAVEMVLLNIQDCRIRRHEMQEGTIELAGLHDEMITIAHS